MTKQRYEGRTAAEAAIKACEALGLTRSELRHTVVSDEGELLARRVVIEVEAAEKRAPSSRQSAPPSDEGRNSTTPQSDEARPPRARRERSRSTSSPTGERRARSAGAGRADSSEDRPGRADEADSVAASFIDALQDAPDAPSGASAPRAPSRTSEDEAAPAPERTGGRSRGRGRDGENRAATPRRPATPRRQPAAAAPAPLAGATSAPADERPGDDASEASTGERGRGRPRSRGRGGRSRNERTERPEGAGRSGEATPAPSVVPTDGTEVKVARPLEASAPAPAPARRPNGPHSPGPSRRGGRNGDGHRSQPTGVDGLLAMQPADDFAHLKVDELPAVSPVSGRSKRVLGMVGDLVRLMGFDLAARLVQENEVEVHVHLYGPAEKEAIGEKGEVLLSLQFAVNRMLSRHEDEGEQVLVLDAGGYRQRRQLAIEKLARDLAERALAHSKAVRLSPMSAHDRRIFHLALKDFPGIATQSEGDGVFRNLLIVPSAFL